MKYLFILFTKLLISCTSTTDPAPSLPNLTIRDEAIREYKEFHASLNMVNANKLTIDPILAISTKIKESTNPYLKTLLNKAQDLTEVDCNGSLVEFKDCKNKKYKPLSLKEIRVKKQANLTKEICQKNGAEYQETCKRQTKFLTYLNSAQFKFTPTIWHNPTPIEELE